MKVATKFLVAAGLLVVAVTAVSAVGPMRFAAKDQSRLPQGKSEDYGTALVNLSQAAQDQRGRLTEVDDPTQTDVYQLAQGDFEPPHGPMPPRPFGGPPPFPGRPAHAPATRAGCEDRLAFLAGIVGFMNSKLNLQGPQKDAWRKIEQAADPGRGEDAPDLRFAAH